MADDGHLCDRDSHGAEKTSFTSKECLNRNLTRNMELLLQNSTYSSVTRNGP